LQNASSFRVIIHIPRYPPASKTLSLSKLVFFFFVILRQNAHVDLEQLLLINTVAGCYMVFMAFCRNRLVPVSRPLVLFSMFDFTRASKVVVHHRNFLN